MKNLILHSIFYRLILLLIIILWGFECFAQDNTDDIVIQWSGNVVLTGNVTIQYSDRLEILPGTTIDCKSYLIRIYGTLHAEGTFGSEILFYSSALSGWQGIKFIIAKPSVMKYCIIKNINSGVVNNINNGGIIIAETDDFEFSNNIFTQNKSGIHIVNSSTTNISTSNFNNNNIEGRDKGLIYLELATAVNVLNNVFDNNITNRDGIISLNNGSEAWVKENNLFKDTRFPTTLQSNWGYPVIVAKNSSNFQNYLIVQNNQFFNNQNYDVVLYNSAEIPNDQLNLFINNNNFIASSDVAFQTSSIFLRSVYAVVLNNSIKNYNSSAVVSENSKFLISGNLFVGNVSALKEGGAIRVSDYVNYEPQLFNQIRLNKFLNNQAVSGGAIYLISNKNVQNKHVIQFNTFSFNTANIHGGNGGNGGALFTSILNNLEILDNSFDHNISNSNGGALYLFNCNTSFNRNYFLYNKALVNGGAVFYLNTGNESFYLTEIFNSKFYLNRALNGGAIYVNQQISNSNLYEYRLQKNSFCFNKASENGGSCYFEKCKIKVDTNRFSYNFANNGGALFSKSLFDSHITRNLIHGDTATLNGGGVFIDEIVEGNAISLTDNVIQQNVFGLKGGGVYINNSLYSTFLRNLFNNNQPDNFQTSEGGAMYVYNSAINFCNNVLHFNESSIASGCLTLYNDLQREVKIHNSDFISNYGSGGLKLNKILNNSDISIQNSIFWGNNLENSIMNALSNPTINTNYCAFDSPPFLNINNQNKILASEMGFTQASCFYLSANSPCIDKGNLLQVFNDMQDPNNLGYALQPSQGALVNDIGATGGPEVNPRDSSLYCINELNTTNAKFSVSITNLKEKIVTIRDLSLVPNTNSYNIQYHWFFGDGQDMKYIYDPANPITQIVHDYESIVKNPTITLILETANDNSMFSKTIYFNSPIIQLPSKPLFCLSNSEEGYAGLINVLTNNVNLEIENADYVELAFVNENDKSINTITLKFDLGINQTLNNALRFLAISQKISSFRARGINQDGCGPWSELFEMSKLTGGDNITNTKLIKSSGTFSVFPNPSTGKFELQINSALENTFCVSAYNMVGELVFSQFYPADTQNILVDFSNKANGVYYINLINGELKYAAKIIINQGSH